MVDVLIILAIAILFVLAIRKIKKNKGCAAVTTAPTTAAERRI